VLLSLHGEPFDSPHDKLCRLLMFISTLKDHGAARVTAVVPYLAYARKDARTKAYDPLGLRWVAQMFEAAGVAQVIVLEAHNVAAFQNAFRCPTVHLRAHRAFAALAKEFAGTGPLVVASPDPGGVKRVQLWREELESQWARPVQFAMVDKRRTAGLLSGGHIVAGDVEGATVLLLDDLIATGETLQRSAAALLHAGARQVIAFAAHGLFVDRAPQLLMDKVLAHIVVTDSVPPLRLPLASPARAKLQIASCVPLFAEAIRDSRTAWWQ
jgi:ribose-phosphate pyrophosphokinase